MGGNINTFYHEEGKNARKLRSNFRATTCELQNTKMYVFIGVGGGYGL
jgi:hypothetical protein